MDIPMEKLSLVMAVTTSMTPRKLLFPVKFDFAAKALLSREGFSFAKVKTQGWRAR